MPTLIPLGVLTTLTEDVVYTLPSKRIIIYSDVALQTSNGIAFGSVGTVSANSATGADAMFVRCSTANANVLITGF
jgi:hypothetical protein